jgi:hypothetical protein
VAVAQDAVGDDLISVGHGHVERVRRLVDRMVVHGEPGRRHLGLSCDRDPVRRGHEAGPDVEARKGELDRNAVVGDVDLEALPSPDRSTRRDGQLLAAARPRRLPVADLDVAHLEPDEVQVEAAQVLGGPGGDGRLPVETVRRGVVGDVEVVVADVVAAIAVAREIGVAHAGRARRTRPRGLSLRGAGAEGADQEGDAGGNGSNAGAGPS